MFDKLDDIIKPIIAGLIVLILAICGNYVGNTLSCHTQRLLKNNMKAKHAIVFLSLFVGIDALFQQTHNQQRQNPLHTLGMTAFLYILFLLFTRMTKTFTILAFFLTVSLYLVDLFNDYFKGTHDTVVYAKRGLSILLALCIFVGFILYLKEKIDQKNDFSFKTFIFGITKCDKSIKLDNNK